MQAKNHDLEVYTELLDQKNVNLPVDAERSLEDLEKQLEAIEYLLAVRVSLRDLTEPMIKKLESDIRTIIIAGIRKRSAKTLQASFESSSAVLTNLTKACDELNKALDQVKKGVKKPQYYTCMRSCQECLAQALKYWQRSTL